MEVWGREGVGERKYFFVLLNCVYFSFFFSNCYISFLFIIIYFSLFFPSQNSSTIVVPKVLGQELYISQSYSEGENISYMGVYVMRISVYIVY